MVKKDGLFPRKSVKGYGRKKMKAEEEIGQDSVPIGYEEVINMYRWILKSSYGRTE